MKLSERSSRQEEKRQLPVREKRIKETEKASLCKTFKALPEDADIKAYWRTKHSRMVLILKTDGEDPINSEYYVHAEPIK